MSDQTPPPHFSDIDVVSKYPSRLEDNSKYGRLNTPPIPACMILEGRGRGPFFTVMCASNEAHDTALWFNGVTPADLAAFLRDHEGHYLR